MGIFPNLDLAVELNVGGWVDLAALGLVRVAGGIAIKCGRDDEIASVQAGTCALTLDNADGRFSPRNPVGAWYGLIGRNTPLRVYVRPHLAAGPGMDDTDAFARTVSAGWGSTPGGNAYTTWYSGGTHTTTDASVSSGTGVHSVPAASAWRGTMLHGLSAEDVEVTATCQQMTANVTGGVIETGGIMLRVASDLSAYYLCRVEVATDETMTAKIYRGDSVQLATAAVAASWGFGQAFTFRARTIGTTISYKVWPATDAEPAAWTVEADDDTVTSPGGVGFRSGVGSGNTNPKPLVFTWDNVAIVPIATRFHGEVSQWPVRWNLKGSDVYVTAQAAGVIRRLKQGAKTARSALAAAILALNPVAYWSLDDGPYATVGSSAVADGTQSGLAVTGDILLSQVAGPDGAPELLPQMARDVSFAAVALKISLSGSTGGSYTIDFVIRGDITNSADAFEPFLLTWSDATNVFGVTGAVDRIASPATYTIKAFGGPAPTAAGGFSSVASADVFDGHWHHIRVTVSTSGGTTTGTIKVDNSITASSAASFTSTNVQSIGIFNMAKTFFDSLSIGHVGVFSGVGLATTYPAFIGHVGETVAARLGRLETQYGVAIALRDRADSISPPLTVQRPAGLVDLLADVQSADLGVLVEARNAAALRYRALGSLVNQTPVQLSYSGCHLAPGLDTTDDDQGVWNDVTVERYGGSKTRLTLDAGALSTLPPPAGVGTYDRGPFTSHIDTSARLDDVASWLLGIGTWDEARCPAICVELAAPDVAASPALVWQLLGLDVGDALGITDLPAWLPPDDVAGIVQGYTETIGPKTWSIQFTTTPAGPYQVGVYDDPGSRYEATTAALDADITAGQGSFDVAYTGPRYVRAADDAASLPFDILVGGERMTVTDVFGTSSPQTFTVTRAVNGVVKAHDAGAEVRLFQQARYAP